jgi:hypothetical protein
MQYQAHKRGDEESLLSMKSFTKKEALQQSNASFFLQIYLQSKIVRDEENNREADGSLLSVNDRGSREV